MSPAQWFDAEWFDGRNAQPSRVEIGLDRGELAIRCAGARVLNMALARVEVSELGVRLPVRLNLDDGSALSVPAAGDFLQALRGQGWCEPLASRLQRRSAGLLLVVVVTLVAGLYGWGVPWTAQAVARILPAAVEQSLGDSLLHSLESSLLADTTVDPAHQTRLRERLRAAAVRAAPGLEYQLEFRRLRSADAANVPNAFALAGGHVILLDALTRSGLSDEALIAVLAHELGHVAQRHSTQALFKVLSVPVLSTMVFGDWSVVMANAIGALQFLDYSRAAEREADDFALRFLAASGIGAEPLLDAFDYLDGWVSSHGSTLPMGLSSHPGLEERKARVRERIAPHP